MSRDRTVDGRGSAPAQHKAGGKRAAGAARLVPAQGRGKPTRRRRPSPQLALPLHKGKHGGAREGAGRPRKTGPSEVAHRPRARFSSARPLIVTLRLTRVAAELGRRRLHRVIRAVFVQTCRRNQFRIVHYNVEHDHVHLVVESTTRAAMTQGMRSVDIRIAKQVNRALGRRSGKVLAHRYHERVLTTPTEVRNALRYVLNNFRRHLWKDRGERCALDYLDPCSSARYFDGWRGMPPPESPGPGAPVTAPRTALVRHLWRRRGLIDPSEVPGGR